MTDLETHQTMKRYLLFSAIGKYGPFILGGWEDYRGDFDNLEETIRAGEEYSRNLHWWHVVDLLAGKIVCECACYRRFAEEGKQHGMRFRCCKDCLLAWE